MITLDLSILNQKGTPMFNSDTLANRPAAGIVGRIFIAIDAPYGIYRDTGSAWDQISGASTFSGSLATGQVAFGSATNTISGSNNLVFDNANARFGIGTNNPLASLQINGAGNNSSTTSLSVNNLLGTNLFSVRNDGLVSVSNTFFVGTGTNGFTITNSTISNGLVDIRSDRVQLRVNSGPVYFYNQGDSSSASTIIMAGRDGSNTNFAPVIIGSGTGATLSRETMRVINQTQNVHIGTTFVADNGNRLQVYGNAYVSEAITARRTITSNGDSTDFGGFFYTNGFGVTTNTIFSLNTPVLGGTINSNYALINDQNGLGSLTSATANYLQIASERNPGSPQITATGIINFINLTTRGISRLGGSSSVTYNAINIDYTINRSGAGIMRGFYYNPTITSLGGSVHNAIQTTSGNVLFGSNFFWDNTNGSLGIGTNSIYAPATFNLDVNGGLLVKNTAGRTAQITLINADPSIGGNNGFLVASVGGTSGGSYVDFQGYYGASIVGSTALRLNPAGGAVIVNSTTNSGEQFQLTGTIRVNGQTSGSAGGNSGQHLIINCDGTTYKIALLNP